MSTIAVRGVGALIHTPDNRYLLQLRDAEERVSMRGYWGLFGGVMEAGEVPEDTLRRELFEELGWSVQAVGKPFTDLEYSLDAFCYGRHWKVYYELPISDSTIDQFRLGEGQSMALHTVQSLLAFDNVVPWDLYSVLLHARRREIGKVLRPIP